MSIRNEFNNESESIKIISQINQITKYNWILKKIENAFLIVFEIICYVLLLFFLVWIFSFRDNELIDFWLLLIKNIDKRAHVSAEEISDIYYFLKTCLIIFITFQCLLPAFLFRRLRKKNFLIEKVNKLTESFNKKNLK